MTDATHTGLNRTTLRSIGLVAAAAVAAIVGFAVRDGGGVATVIPVQQTPAETTMPASPAGELEPALRRLDSGGDHHG